MKKLLLGAVALAAMAVPGAAYAEGSGDLNLGYSSLDAGDSDLDGAIRYGGAGYVGFSNGWNLQVDAQNSRIDVGGGDITLTEGAVHAFYRTEGWAAGGFVSYGDAFYDAIYGVGAEGQLYLGQFTLNGSIETISSDNYDSDDIWAATLGGDFFITDNLQVGASVQMVDADDEELTTFNVGGEWRIGDSPFSIYADYDVLDEDYIGDDVNIFTIGGRWNFGTGSLLERNRSGASMERGSNFMQALFLPAI